MRYILERCSGKKNIVKRARAMLLLERRTLVLYIRKKKCKYNEGKLKEKKKLAIDITRK